MTSWLALGLGRSRAEANNAKWLRWRKGVNRALVVGVRAIFSAQ